MNQSVDQIVSTYNYSTVQVEGTTITPVTESYTFKTSKRVPKTGMMLVGWGGNNGCTVFLLCSQSYRADRVELRMAVHYSLSGLDCLSWAR